MTTLAPLNGHYATIEEMAASHSRAKSSWARRAVTHLLEANSKHPHVRWQLMLVLMLVSTLVSILGTLPMTPKAYAAGETYNWDSKTRIEITPNGRIAENPSGFFWYLNQQGSTNKYGGIVRDVSGCNLNITATVSSNHATATLSFSTGPVTNPCAAGVFNEYDKTANFGNMAVWSDGSGNNIPMNCPGGPSGPTNGSYPCPNGGQVVNGVYYPDNNIGRISGRVTLEAGCNQASCACPNATVNVTRVNGVYTGDVTVKTGGDGTFVLNLGAGVVTLSTPDCKKKDGSIYSGQSGQITVEPLKSKGGNNYVAGTLVATAGEGDSVCDNADFSELNWFICAAINTLARAAEKLDSAILGLIKIDTESIFNDSGSNETSEGYFRAWAAFRNIAYAILVMFALVMIASQILNMDFVDAYTFRKLLPKIIIATILIAFSWNGLNFVFNLANDAADAIQAVIKAPFAGIDVGLGNTTSNTLTLGILLQLLLSIGAPAGVAALAFLGLGGIAALVVSIALAVFSAWVILVARDVVASLLIITSPIAIIFWAFKR